MLRVYVIRHRRIYKSNSNRIELPSAILIQFLYTAENLGPYSLTYAAEDLHAYNTNRRRNDWQTVYTFSITFLLIYFLEQSFWYYHNNHFDYKVLFTFYYNIMHKILFVLIFRKILNKKKKYDSFCINKFAFLILIYSYIEKIVFLDLINPFLMIKVKRNL